MKGIFLLLLTSATVMSCVTGQIAQTKNTKKTANKSDSLTDEINEIYKKGIFNGFGVSIVNEDGILYQKGFGFSDVSAKKTYTEKTIQNIASVSKTFVGIALLKAQELGKLNLDDPIEKYLPFKVVNPNFPEAKITIRQLANHTSSIIDNEYYLTKSYILRPNQDLKGVKLSFDETQLFNPSDSLVSLEVFLKNSLSEKGKWFQTSGFLTNKPGEIYEYSNTGTALAGYIIERATGTSFANFTKEYILNPLKMTDSGWKYEDIKLQTLSRLYENPETPLPYYESLSYPDGGLMTSVNDLSKFLTELIKGYHGKGSILNKESYKEYFKAQLSASNFTERNERNPYSESYNVGIFIGFGYTGYIGHTGGDPGVISMMFFDPKSNTGRIMLFNTSFSDKAGNDAFYGIWNLLEKYQDL
ncbi:D-alanyl-D-alanine carboxypeptidase precursor [compost metagenome]